MGDEHRSSPRNFSPSFRSRHFLYFFYFTVVGLSLGLTAYMIIKSLSSNLQATVFLGSWVSQHSSPPGPTPSEVVISTGVSNISSYGSHIHLMHSMDDNELFWRASMVPTVQGLAYQRVPKVAFMFLAKGSLPLMLLWEKFFKGRRGLYSIYIHCDTLYNLEVPRNSAFYGRSVPSKRVEWGKPSMLEAERRLLANALLDSSNERFVLLSETCIPLFNFSTIYSYLMNSTKTFVASYDDPTKIGRGRYPKAMGTTIPISQWRKGSQWFEVNREIAIAIVSERKYYPLFAEYCDAPCYTDEHYIPTLVNILFPGKNSNRTITWVDWSKKGPHPERFIDRDVTIEFLNHIRFGNDCSYNGNATSLCFLFARKFVSNTLKPLLGISEFLFS